MNKKTTIYDIARELNTTISTVSRALNNHPGISVSTKEAVQKSSFLSKVTKAFKNTPELAMIALNNGSSVASADMP